MRRTRTTLVVLVASVVMLTGCGEDTAGDAVPTADRSTGVTSDAPSASSAPAETPSQSEKPRPTGPFADITLTGDTAAPNGERIDLDVGKPLTLRIDSDHAGELHVHSTPEQEIAFPAGQSERRLVIDQPGVVDVEDHASGTVLLQLEVR